MNVISLSLKDYLKRLSLCSLFCLTLNDICQLLNSKMMENIPR